MKKRLLGICAVLSILVFSAGCGQVISESEAKDAAFSAAGVDASSVTVTSTKFDDDDDEYEFEFQSDTTRYEYTIDANNGKVISSEQSQLPGGGTAAPDAGTDNTAKDDTSSTAGDNTSTPADTTSQAAAGDIGEEQAKSIALAQFSKTEAEVTSLRVHQDMDDGVAVYDVEFWVGTTEYSCEIDRATGEVRSTDTDND
ncbi:MAG: PepSY domain-containing protein [Massiliimalia sp.]|jgi:uncharacterized membrane protein YkoI